MSWSPVIGLEIHTRLKTDSKIFSGASAQYGAPPNVRACGVDVALPGVLPVLNRQALRMIVAFGCAIDGEITPRTIMARKHYFYPDLPKGYQISQFEEPVVRCGKLRINLPDGTEKTVNITRAHLEEDAGKSIHSEFAGMSAIDLNRAGVSLAEIVSEPELHSAAEAVAYMKKIYSIVKYLDICDGNMQEGSFRCDVNISVKPADSSTLGTRSEIKNLNSFRFVEKAIEFEIARQIEILETGGAVVQETRLFNAATGETETMRSKEEAHDYRYFPDPDLLPIEISDNYVAEIRAALPELPDAKTARFAEQYGLDAQEASRLVADKAVADYFEDCLTAADLPAKTAANWISSVLLGKLKQEGLGMEAVKITPPMLAELLALIEDATISGKIAKQVFEKMWDGEGSAKDIVEKYGWRQISDSGELDAVIESVIEDNPKQVEQYLAGKDKLLAYFVGQVMKATGGKANPGQVNKLLKQKLK